MSPEIAPTQTRLGVTLIELLVSIGVIGVLLAILTPVLRGALSAAGEVKSLSNLRGVGITFHNYSTSNRDRYPFIYAGEPVQLAPPHEGDPQVASFSPHWLIENLWPVLMHQVAPWEEHFESWLSPGRRLPDPAWPLWAGFTVYESDRVRPVSYVYSNSFVARPRVWSGSAGISNDDISPVRLSETASPSLKVLAFDIDRAYLRKPPGAGDPRPLLLADGSATSRRDDEAATPVRNPLHFLQARRFHDTPDGVLGRDFP